MSLFKKLLPASVTRKKSRESLTSISSGGSSGSSSPTKLSSYEASQSDILDIFLIDVKYKDKRDALNLTFSKHRRRDRKLALMKQGLMEMESEMRELERLISRTAAEMRAVEAEAKDKWQNLENIMKQVDVDAEVEVRRKEPLLFKKYTNLKTASECQTLLKLIQQKQRAVQHVELLTYRKFVKFQHSPLKPERGKAKIQSLLPIKPTRLKESRLFSMDKEPPEGVVYLEIEDKIDDDVIDLTNEDDTPRRNPFDVPLESEV